MTRHIEILNTLSHYYPEDNMYHGKLHTRWNLGRYPGPNTVKKYSNTGLKEASMMWMKKGKHVNMQLLTGPSTPWPCFPFGASAHLGCTQCQGHSPTTGSCWNSCQ
jgi:hypothetical protein